MNFKDWAKLIFLSLILTYVIDILFETPQTGIEFEKHLLHTVPLGLGISRKSFLFKEKRFRGDLFFDVLGLF